jgi:uncharacterized integral membrane protein
LTILVLVALFSGFNLNPTDVSVGFYVFKNVPLFLTLIISFIAGALLMLPFTFKFGLKKRKPKRKKGEVEAPAVESLPAESEEPVVESEE